MSRRSRPQYRSGLGWILGVAFEDTLSRPTRLAQGFTCVRCCGSPRASSPHGLTAPALASHDGKDCVQLPPARGCYHLAPRRTFTSNPVPMPGTPPSVPTPMRRRQQTRQNATYRSRKSVQTSGTGSESHLWALETRNISVSLPTLLGRQQSTTLRRSSHRFPISSSLHLRHSAGAAPSEHLSFKSL